MQILPETAAWPPVFTVRKSRQAKSLQLKISAEKGLEVVVPHRVSVNVELFLETHRAWIVGKLAEFSEVLPQKTSLPTKLHLLSIDQVWEVHYLAASGKPRCLPRPGQVLTVLGDLDNRVGCQKALTEWLREKSKSHLVPWLRRLSEQTQLIYANITIREQKTRWGSCSSKADINLNWKLIFLPPSVTQYIIIHELCHIRHLNHSARFWQLVAEFDPKFKQHRRELRQLSSRVGLWGMTLD